MLLDLIAKIAHEVNRAYCESLGDMSQPLWDDAPDWQKNSALKGVQFHLENPGASASSSHESWLAQKEADGWVHGAVKDPEAKTHPCILPFDQLPLEQQAKDFLFKGVVHVAAQVLQNCLPGSAPAPKPRTRKKAEPESQTS